jgi:hypothetical protein
MQRISTLASILLLMGPGLQARAGLDGDLVIVEQHHPVLGNILRSQSTVAGSGVSLAFGGQNATLIDVDADLITLTLGCDFPACNRITSSEFNGFVLTGLDWSTPPGQPVDLIVESGGKFFDPDRVVLLPGRIEINLWRDVWSDGQQIRILPVYAPQAAIDVIPASDRNVLPRGHRRIPVALLGSPELDVTEVDPFSLRLGPGEAQARWRFLWVLVWWFTESDVNRDGYGDLVFAFDARDAAIPPGADEVCLSGEIGGLPFTACDAVDPRSGE